MSIQSEINRISSNVQNTIAAILTKGGTIGSDATSDDLEDGVLSIPQNVGIRCGLTDVYSVSKGGYTTTDTIAFNPPFKTGTEPTILVCFQSGSTAGDFGNCCVSVAERSNTGFKARIFNGGTAGRNPNISWIAYGQEADS